MIAGALTYFRRLGDEPFLEIMRSAAEAVVPPIADEEISDLYSRLGQEASYTRQTEGEWGQWMEQYFAWRRTLFVGPVQQTTRQQVMAVLEEVVQEGGGIENIAQRMEEQLLGISRNRARVTARTEVVSASNYATQAAGERFAEETETDMVKEWISTLDQRTRRRPRDAFDHREPDGQIVPLNQPFLVSGERLMHPGDVSQGASEGNVIECRCTSAPRFRSAVDESDILIL